MEVILVLSDLYPPAQMKGIPHSTPTISCFALTTQFRVFLMKGVKTVTDFRVQALGHSTRCAPRPPHQIPFWVIINELKRVKMCPHPVLSFLSARSKSSSVPSGSTASIPSTLPLRLPFRSNRRPPVWREQNPKWIRVKPWLSSAGR